MKIKKEDLKNLKGLAKQGGSLSSVYSGTLNGHEVIIKVQDKGSLEKTNKKDDRFLQELNILQLGLPSVVRLIGTGDDFDGERFIVLEKLELIEGLSKEQLFEFSKVILITSRQLYLRGLNWVATKDHLGINREEGVKLLDFNDDNYQERSFLNRHTAYDVFNLINLLCKQNNVDSKQVIKEATTELVKQEYLSLQNAHEPIYFEPYTKFFRTESEPDDAKFMQPVSANRTCFDRKKIILEAIQRFPGSSVLDIGCNVGWFTFMLEESNFKATGIDFDKPGNYREEGWKNGTGGKIEFNRMMVDLHPLKPSFEFADVTPEYVKQMPKYDIVIALSILHLYFTQHKVSKEYWFNLFKLLCDKANKAFIFETSSNIFKNIGVASFKEFAELAKKIGGFAESRIIGESKDAKRPIIGCFR